ncbi:hypothetical protein ACB092_05G272700 [Castanea dentata]
MHCPECNSYLQPPRTWIKAQLEPKELLTFCVKRLKNLNKVRLVHAEFIWTEPHSKRIKVKLKVQKEVLNGAILDQSYAVEYVQQEHWVAAVQLRQHVSHRRTFFYLEQLILKHDATASAIKIKQMEQGIDFFFSNRSHGVKFVEFIGMVAPMKSRNDKQLDLICLPLKVAASLGNLGPLVNCTKVTNVALLDPLTLRVCYLDADRYWRLLFKSLLTSRQLVEYIMLDVEIISSEVNVGGSKYVLADAQVARKKRGKPRAWKLKSLDIEVDDKNRTDQEKINLEYEQFLKDLEENPELRFNISLYRNKDYQPSEMTSVADGDDIPSIPLDELLADLDLSEAEAEDEDDDMKE